MNAYESGMIGILKGDAGKPQRKRDWFIMRLHYFF